MDNTPNIMLEFVTILSIDLMLNSMKRYYWWINFFVHFLEQSRSQNLAKFYTRYKIIFQSIYK